ncbi:uncharacterized protein (DUF342 family) [Alkalibacillus filiformis]|uniref:Uncharacterized protein (DUF342 family) n=1 Tax=Alkalibacillus filiformis TaxID=200990 RepID=A0ABU0DW10_9BACI|nr:FapA family protein [Alkalibacillus filiformis]MDQ0352524.1 uncharacterized protein (DUF342 family) [Alkalibacillus filiformis]
MQEIVSKGKSLDEAVQNGLNLLNTSKEQVNIEIIQTDTSGFFGVGKKPAIVKLTLNNQNSVTQNQEMSHFNLEDWVETLSEEITTYEKDGIAQPQENVIKEDALKGKAWIEDGKIGVKNSSERYPSVSISTDVFLIKNGEEITNQNTILTEEDEVKIKVEEPIIKETDWNIKVEEQGLKVTLNVQPGQTIYKHIVDQEPNEHVELMAEETIEKTNTLKLEDIMLKLKEFGVIYGVDQDEISLATETLEESTFVIATGREPQLGEDGWVEYKVETSSKKTLVENEDGTIDFRESKSIPSVEKGEILAKIHLPKLGIPGLNVMNQPLPAKQSHPVVVKTGNGVIEVENQLVATESGRPSIETRGLLMKASIIPKLTHHENVNLSSGNIKFNGDVEVIGEVEENMTVDAEGDLFIHQSVSYASLTTLSSILVKGNITSSTLEAGKHNMLIIELGHILRNLHQQLGKMLIVIEQLTKTSAFKSSDFSINGLQPLIKILLEKRFKGFYTQAKQYKDIVSKGESNLDEEWRRLAIDLNQTFLSLSNKIIKMEHLNRIMMSMKELADISDIPVEPNAQITISEAHNSSLYCSGNISVIGKGCINSKVHAGGHLHIKGILRGGEIYGRLGVTINEVGSRSGTKTLISVPADQTIFINKALEGTILKVGSVSYKVNDTMDNVIVKLNHNDEIVIEPYGKEQSYA